MNPEDKMIAVSAFIKSVCGKIILADATGSVQLREAFNLETALEAAFDAVGKHKYERGIIAAEKRDSVVIFDP
jgi:hypothetical protein